MLERERRFISNRSELLSVSEWNNLYYYYITDWQPINREKHRRCSKIPQYFVHHTSSMKSIRKDIVLTVECRFYSWWSVSSLYYVSSPATTSCWQSGWGRETLAGWPVTGPPVSQTAQLTRRTSQSTITELRSKTVANREKTLTNFCRTNKDFKRDQLFGPNSGQVSKILNVTVHYSVTHVTTV